MSREGAFLVNNLLFVAFAFVVLLGTVFPLLYEAFRGQQVTVGAPYFDAMALPIGLALLFLMAVGPALPWRKAHGRRAARPPAWSRPGSGSLVVVGCVVGGVRGLAPLAAFGLGGFAAAANIRQLVLAARRAQRQRRRGVAGFVGRANGGMVVHLGVVVIAVALAAATSFGHRGEVTLRPGQSAVIDGHRITYVRLASVRSSARTATEALVLVDGHGPYRPAVSQFGSGTEPVGTPAIDSTIEDDVYLTVDALPVARRPGHHRRHRAAPGDVAVGGGAFVVVGAVLAAIPDAGAAVPPIRPRRRGRARGRISTTWCRWAPPAHGTGRRRGERPPLRPGAGR